MIDNGAHCVCTIAAIQPQKRKVNVVTVQL